MSKEVRQQMELKDFVGRNESNRIIHQFSDLHYIPCIFDKKSERLFFEKFAKGINIGFNSFEEFGELACNLQSKGLDMCYDALSYIVNNNETCGIELSNWAVNSTEFYDLSQMFMD